MPHERNLVRVLVAAALGLALTGCVALPSPDDLPSVALGQPALYRLEVALAVYYGCLLIVTPTYSALVAGRLPIEISTRGARFAEEADQAAGASEAALRQLQLSVGRVSGELAGVVVEVNRLKGGETKDDER